MKEFSDQESLYIWVYNMSFVGLHILVAVFRFATISMKAIHLVPILNLIVLFIILACLFVLKYKEKMQFSKYVLLAIIAH
jgi:predicted neutral ceramidase superfamily lipid hydrolase